MSIFNGLAGVLNSVFGAPVTHIPQSGAPRSIQAVFRDEPVDAADADGREILTLKPMLQVQRPDATLSRGDQIDLADGRSFLVMASQDSGSPAADGFVIYELEQLP